MANASDSGEKELGKQALVMWGSRRRSQGKLNRGMQQLKFMQKSWT